MPSKVGAVRPPHQRSLRACVAASPPPLRAAETSMLKKTGEDLKGLMNTHKRVEAAADRVEALDAETGKRCAILAAPRGQIGR